MGGHIQVRVTLRLGSTRSEAEVTLEQGFKEDTARGGLGRLQWTPGLTGTFPERAAAVPAHSHCEAQHPAAKGCSTLGTVLGLVHTDQLALQADVADAVLLCDWLGHGVEGQRECPS